MSSRNADAGRPICALGKGGGGWGWGGHCKAGASLREEALEDVCLHTLSHVLYPSLEEMLTGLQVVP